MKPVVTNAIRRIAGNERVREYADIVLEPVDYIVRLANGTRRLPPLRIRRHSGALSTFETSAASVLGYLNGACGLNRSDRILDIGCGAGAIALQLQGYLEPTGRYVGVDVHRPSIRWARRNIQRRNPQFTFQLADLRNDEYNPGGKHTAEDYRFPFGDGAFDLVIGKSVFTHLRPAEADNYLRELARLLAPDGHALATFFLLGPERDAMIARGGSIDFPHGEGAWRYHDAAVPERAAAFTAEYVLTALDNAGLMLARPVLHGYQDVLLLQPKK